MLSWFLAHNIADQLWRTTLQISCNYIYISLPSLLNLPSTLGLFWIIASFLKSSLANGRITYSLYVSPAPSHLQIYMHLHPYFPHYYLTESKIWASYWKPSFSLYEILSSGCVYVSFSLISLSVYSQQVFKHAEITNILKNQQQKKKIFISFPYEPDLPKEFVNSKTKVTHNI